MAWLEGQPVSPDQQRAKGVTSKICGSEGQIGGELCHVTQRTASFGNSLGLSDHRRLVVLVVYNLLQ